MTALPDWLTKLRDRETGLYHPNSVKEIQKIVVWAGENGVNVRTRGSAHSVPGSIWADNTQQNLDDTRAINLYLDKLIAVDKVKPRMNRSTNTEESVVRVEGGCHLGRDPYDPTTSSTWDNSLFVQLDKQGYAFGDMGGIVHQTVGGFTTMGCAGGSLKYDVGGMIRGIEIVDGNGDVRTYWSDEPGDEEAFRSLGVSMGLFGIVTAMWFAVIPRYWIAGTEKTYYVDQSADPSQQVPIDLFGDQPVFPSIKEYFTNTPYSRLLWWPQPHVNKMVVWEAHQIPYNENYKARKPYQEMPWIAGSPLPVQAAAGELYTLVGTWPRWLRNFFDPVTSTLDPNVHLGSILRYIFSHLVTVNRGKKDEKTFHDIMQIIEDLESGSTTDLHLSLTEIVKLCVAHLGTTVEVLGFVALYYGEYEIGAITFETMIEKIIDALFEPILMPLIVNSFVSVTEDQQFNDIWYGSLPMDNQIDDRLFPVEFTELWVPMENATVAMRDIRDLFASKGLEATGTFSTELYAGTASDFYLSPAHDTEVFRFDFFWFSKNDGEPALKFYKQFWEVLKDHKFRFHWAKWLSDPSSATGVPYRQGCYPQWSTWMNQRKAHDPKNVFLNQYWADHLGIQR